MAEVITCPTCGVCYSVPDVWLTARRESHDTFWCPNGHPASYKKETEVERLNRECEELRKSFNFEREELRQRNEALYDEVKRLREMLERRAKQKKS